MTELQERVQNLIGQAKLFVAGAEIETGSENAQTRLLHGFHELVARTYPNLRMLRGSSYTANDIANCLKYSQHETVWKRRQRFGRIRRKNF